LGDVLHASAAARTLADAGYRVDFLTEPRAVPLVEGQPAVAHVIAYDRRGADRGARAFARLARRLRSARYAVVADLQANVRSRLLALASGARRRVSYRKDPLGTPRHAVENFAATLAPLGLSAGPAPAPELRPSATARAAAARALADAGLPVAGRRLVALHVGASQPHKTWSPGSLGELAARLARRPGIAVAFTSAREDRDQLETAIRAARAGAGAELPIADLGGRLDLPGLAALYAGCAAVVVADTGPLHIAAAAGVPTIGLFGPTDPVRTGPFGNAGHRVVQVALDCVPCRSKSCRRTDRPLACMVEMTPAMVEAAVLAALADRRVPAGASGKEDGRT
jgi:ADP-heptose:LPS heptosyltransferase